MRRSLAFLGIFVALGLVSHETMGQCSFSTTSCFSGALQRKCFRDGPVTGAAACTGGAVANLPATSAYTTTTSSTFIMASCRGPLGVTLGDCSFNGCGVCGTFKVDMVNGMPVELMEFAIEDGSDAETSMKTSTEM